MNRRAFLRRLEAMSTAGVIVGCGAATTGCLGFHYAGSSLVGGRLLVRRADFGTRGFVLVDHPASALPLYVHQRDDGEFVALSTRCMHRGCQVEPGDGKLVCPCHGSEYSADGAVLKGPTRLPLERYAVTADEEFVRIDVSRPLAES